MQVVLVLVLVLQLAEEMMSSTVLLVVVVGSTRPSSLVHRQVWSKEHLVAVSEVLESGERGGREAGSRFLTQPQPQPQ